jgi:hypothetical protein
MTEMKQKPKNLNSASEKELDKVAQQFDKFDAEVKEMTMDRMNMAPKEEVEPQTKLSQNEIAASKDVYLKPHKVISCREKFNEKYRDEYNYQKEYVNFIAEHKELIGESIDIWTRPFPGMPAEEWLVPTNTPVWGPRYLAEQIKRKFYHRLVMKENVVTDTTGMGVMYGKMAADTTIQRLDAQPVTKRKSIFMGDKSF